MIIQKILLKTKNFKENFNKIIFNQNAEIVENRQLFLTNDIRTQINIWTKEHKLEFLKIPLSKQNLGFGIFFVTGKNYVYVDNADHHTLIIGTTGSGKSFSFILPLLVEALGEKWGSWAGAAITIVIIAPFLRAMIMKKNHSIELKALWKDSRFKHAPLISVIILRIVIGVFFDDRLFDDFEPLLRKLAEKNTICTFV